MRPGRPAESVPEPVRAPAPLREQLAGRRLDRYRDGPLGVVMSREWNDLIATVVGVQVTGDISSSVHHHDPGGVSGSPHNLNPGWFAGPAPGPDEIRVPSDGDVQYNHGTRPEGVEARETVRGVPIVFYLANEPWQPGDGGETGLYRHGRADALAAAAPPVNNSMVIFKCTPSCVARRFWMHRDRATEVQPQHRLDQETVSGQVLAVGADA